MWNDRVLGCDALYTTELIKQRFKREANDEWPSDKGLEEDRPGTLEGRLTRTKGHKNLNQ